MPASSVAASKVPCCVVGRLGLPLFSFFISLMIGHRVLSFWQSLSSFLAAVGCVDEPGSPETLAFAAGEGGRHSSWKEVNRVPPNRPRLPVEFGARGVMDRKDKRIESTLGGMNRVRIRRARAADIPAVVRVATTSASKEETEGFAAAEWVTYSAPAELRKVWAGGNRLKDGSEVVVAERAGRVVGFIVFRREPGYIYIDDIDVTRRVQRRGIGKALVSHVEDVARVEEFTCIKTDTTENAEGVAWKSYGFWTRLGYCDTGERLCTQWSFKTIPFVKRLR